MSRKYDFGGYATKNDLLCTDGVIIKKNAFKDNDGMRVPLVWQHQHNDPDNVLGHAILENRDDGVYAYCYLNDTPKGEVASKLVKHGDVSQLSIWAGRLKRASNHVKHGLIREVSLVLSGANPGALIDTVISHGVNDDDDEGLEQGILRTGEPIELYHAEEDTSTRTLKEIMDTLNEEQETAVNILLGLAVEDAEDGEEEDDVEHADNTNEEGDGKLKYNLFDRGTRKAGDGEEIFHSEEFKNALSFDEIKRHGSLKESFIQHGIQDIEYLFPEATSLNTPPQFITRDMGWVGTVMSGVHKTPFSRIKSMFADLTEDEARARGYLKGTYKKEQFFTLLKRTTEAKTIYKKQKLDRDDIIDIEFDVVPWIKKEMRFMLDEEIARAILVGDGRPSDSEDKIAQDKIRPIWTDDALYTIKTTVSVPESATSDQRAKAFIRSALKSRKDYRGSGNPVLYTTEDFLTDCLLLEDAVGRIIYDSVSKLATTLRVREIVTVPVMEGLTRVREDSAEVALAGIIVNLNDYNVGADKGGSINMFEDFDIDYNQQKYLIETKISGALTRPYSAIALEFVEVEDEDEGV